MKSIVNIKENMKNHPIKKYAIHILAVTALCDDAFDIPHNKCALILLTNRTNPYIDALDLRKIVIDILDVEDKNHPRAFTRTHANFIIWFINNLPKEVTDIYVCCSKGGSRSPGCAAALMLMSGRSDKDVWLNPFYTPNLLVFQLLCKEFGIFMPYLFVYIRLIKNNRAFHKAQKVKGICPYERWQILE